ncbi:unnamed protein product [Timema podura]|uniref:Nose resistant-to-fluoxetine protein N-terminal domain-containing protein n=1 Tax=Timema podura TaxID=61482 RepID=A0ABN7NSR4_TIMPD|nr:unnamed protein product [Timema podura]
MGNSISPEEKLAICIRYMASGAQAAYGDSSKYLFKWSFCIPSTCTSDDWKDIHQHFINKTQIPLEVSVHSDNCQTAQDKPFNAAEYTAILVFGFFGILTIFSTAYDIRMGESVIPYSDSIVSSLEQRFSEEHSPAFSLLALTHPYHVGDDHSRFQDENQADELLQNLYRMPTRLLRKLE